MDTPPLLYKSVHVAPQVRLIWSDCTFLYILVHTCTYLFFVHIQIHWVKIYRNVQKLLPPPPRLYTIQLHVNNQ